MDPHSPPPYAYLPQPEDVDPYVEKIWDDLWICTLPDSEYYSLRDVILPFLDDCKEGIASSCCAPHKTSNMSLLRTGCLAGAQCTCNEHPLFHKFLAYAVTVFDKHMSQCMQGVMVKKILHDRQN